MSLASLYFPLYGLNYYQSSKHGALMAISLGAHSSKICYKHEPAIFHIIPPCMLQEVYRSGEGTAPNIAACVLEQVNRSGEYATPKMDTPSLSRECDKSIFDLCVLLTQSIGWR